MNASILMFFLVAYFVLAADDSKDIPSVTYPIAPAVKYGGSILAAQASDRLYVTYPLCVAVWNMQQPQQEKEIDHEKVSFMQLNSDESRFFSGSHDGIVKVWDAHEWKLLHEVQVDSRLQDLLYADDMLYAGGDRAIKVFSVKNDACALVGLYAAMACLINFKLYNNCLYYTDGYRVIDKRDQRNMSEPIICHMPGGMFEMDEQYLFLAERHFDNPLVRVFKKDDNGFQKQAKLKGHEHGIMGLHRIKDSNVLCSSSYDKTIRLWDSKTFALLVTLKCKDAPWNVAASKNVIYARYLSGDIQTWNIAKFLQPSI